MRTETATTFSLVETLETLKTHTANYNEAAEELFSFSFSDYNLLFELDRFSVSPETFIKVPVLETENFTAVIVLWGVDKGTAIHDRTQYDGRIKVLKGSLTEVSFRENDNFIEYNGTETAHTNEIFPEGQGGVHSFTNISDDVSVSLHIYRPSQKNLDGIRIFDTENRRIGWLNQHATAFSWQLPKNSYSKIVSI